MGRIIRHFFKLSGHMTANTAINREQSDFVVAVQKLAQLCCHIRTAVDVNRIVEDRISAQNYVLACHYIIAMPPFT